MRSFLIASGLLLAALVVAGLFLPDRVQVEQEIVVQRPATTVFTVLNGFTTFERWTPLREVDPSVVLERSGPASGAGARIAWSGHPSRLGVGWREITDSTAPVRIDYRSEGGAAGAASSRVIIRGDALASRVSWSRTLSVSEGEGLLSGWLGRYFGWFLERWARESLEQELAALKRYAESLPAADFSGARIERLELAPIDVARAEQRLAPNPAGSPDPAAISAALSEGFEAIARWALATDAVLGEAPIALQEQRPDGAVSVSALIAVVEPPQLPSPDGSSVKLALTPAGPAVRILHRGPYSKTQQAYERLEAWLAAHGLAAAPISWEQYLDDPATTAPDELRTWIYLALDEDGAGGRDAAQAGSVR